MAGYAVDPGELRRGDAGVVQSSAAARAALERLRAGAEELFADGWHGPAAAAFRLGWERWLSGALEMVAALDATAALLGSAAGGYVSADAAVRADAARTSP